MATHTDSSASSLGDSDSIGPRFVPGDKVKVIYLHKIRTATVLTHYDGVVTVKWHDVIIKRNYSQVASISSR